MYSYSVVKAGEPLELLERPLPELEGSQVLVRNLYAGVCHSDLHNWKNDFRNLVFPCTLGHEMEGELVAVGPDVTDSSLKLGARYLVFPWVGCAAKASPCKMCARGTETCCTVGRPESWTDGKTIYGGYSSHAVVPHPRYLIDVSVVSNVPEGVACIYMCSGLTTFSALKKVGNNLDGPDDILILGCGGLGMQAIQFAKYLYKGAPLAADVSPGARAAAESFGCKVYDPSQKGAVQAIRKEYPEGLAAVVDLVGSPATAKFASGVLRPGGTLVCVGFYGGKLELTTPLVAVLSLRIQGSFVGTLAEAHEMLEVVKAGAVQPIPHQIRDISEINEVLDDLSNGRIVGRCILRHPAARGNRL